MKKILVIGGGAMGSAFTVPCIENNNEVTIIGSVLENDFISSIKSNKNLHPSLNVILPNNIKIEKFEKITEVTDIDLDLIVVGVSSSMFLQSSTNYGTIKYGELPWCLRSSPIRTRLA